MAHEYAVSGSYIVNAILGGALLYVWNSIKGAGVRSHENATALKLVNVEIANQKELAGIKYGQFTKDITEVKEKLDRVLERLPAKSS